MKWNPSYKDIKGPMFDTLMAMLIALAVWFIPMVIFVKLLEVFGIIKIMI